MSHIQEITRNPSFLKKSKASLVLFICSIVVFLYYANMNYGIIDVYKYAVIGAVDELLWLPMLLFLVAIPVLSILMLIKKSENKWMSVASLLIVAITIVMLFTAKPVIS